MKIVSNGVDVRVSFGSQPPPPAAGKRTEIKGWTKRSIGALTWYVSGTSSHWKAHMVLTYPGRSESWPTSGPELKRQLNVWLQRVRRLGMQYTWLLEFQDRDAPHYHVLLSKFCRSSLLSLKRAWLEIVDGTSCPLLLPPGRYKHGIYFTEIYNTGFKAYIRGDLRKWQQKQVPEQYSKIGKLWGHSRSVKCPELEFDVPGADVYELMEVYSEWCRKLKLTSNPHRRPGFTMWDNMENFKKWLTSTTT